MAPKPIYGTPMKPITTRLPPALHTAWAEQARLDGISQAQLLEQLLLPHLSAIRRAKLREALQVTDQ